MKRLFLGLLLVTPVFSASDEKLFDFKAKPVRETIRFVWKGENKVLKKGSRVIDPEEWIKFQKQANDINKSLKHKDAKIAQEAHKRGALEYERELMKKFEAERKQWLDKEREFVKSLIDEGKKRQGLLRRRNRNLNRKLILKDILFGAFVLRGL